MDLKNNSCHCEGCENSVDVVCEFVRGDERVEKICGLTTKQAVECMTGFKSHRKDQSDGEV